MKHVVENIICGWLLFTTSVCASYSSGHEEETEVQLKCNVSDVQQFPRMWYRGYFTINPDYKKELIYQHTASNPIECRKSSTSCRNDISADITTFEMTIGKVQLEDDDFFTCMVTYPNKEYGQQKVDVYVQPADVKMFIEIDGEPNGNETLHLKPKQNVNVTCVVERLYPELKEGNRPFTITWGDKDESSYTSAPNGNAFTYTVTMNTNVTIDHKNGTIVCKLDPAIGTSVQSGKNVTVTLPEPALHSGLSCWEIVGIVIGSLAGVALIGGIVYGICVWCGCIVHLGCCKCKKGAGKRNIKFHPSLNSCDKCEIVYTLGHIAQLNLNVESDRAVNSNRSE